MAQEKMRITMNDGTNLTFDIRAIKDVSFGKPRQLDVFGDWVSSQNGRMLISLSLNYDGTFIHNTFLVNSQIVLEKRGIFTLKSNVITLINSGNEEIEIISISDSEFYTSKGEVFYKVQEPFYTMKIGEAPMSVGNDGDVIKFFDNYYITLDGNKVKPLKKGEGYVIVEDIKTGVFKAYKVIVSQTDSVVDWTQYFKKSKEEIIDEFGVAIENEEDKTLKYLGGYDSSIKYITFTFSEDFSKVIKVWISFYDKDKMQKYSDEIAKKYIYSNIGSAGTYYDTDNSSNASVSILITNSQYSNSITYTDLVKEKEALPETIDWTQYLRKTRDEITSIFGNDYVENESDTQIRLQYTHYNSAISNLMFIFNKQREKVKSIKLEFTEKNKMQNYCDEIPNKYFLLYSTEYSNQYYDADNIISATTSVDITIISTYGYIMYSDIE